jgi:DNA polymerase III subunit epsilon
MKVCIVDTESTGIGDGAVVIEIAAIVYDCWARSMVSAWSVTLKTEVVNDAMHINHIPDGIGQVSYAAAMAHLKRLVGMCEHVIAHNAAYDRSVLPELADASWLCSYADIAWPKSDPKNLAELCLRHGVSMSRSHRAIDDCLGIVSLLDRVGETLNPTVLIENAVARRDEPRVTVQAIVSFDGKDDAKRAGFRWDGLSKRWLKDVRQSEAEGLRQACNFRVVNV